MASDPIAGTFVRPEVFRTNHVERDLAHYWRPSWRDRVDLLPETQFYAERITTIAADDPIAWIAHGYTRYLADLSGGLVIDKAITEAYGLEQDGRWLYTFDLPAGVDPKRGRTPTGSSSTSSASTSRPRSASSRKRWSRTSATSP